MKGFIKQNRLSDIQYKEKQIDYFIKGEKIHSSLEFLLKTIET